MAGELRPLFMAGAGDVVGPSSSLDGSIALFSGTTGKLLRDSACVLTAAGKAILDDNNTAEQRATLGLGSAAVKDAQSSASDYTAGRVLTVGGAGIAGFGISKTAAGSLNTVTGSGFYALSAASAISAGGPIAENGVVEHVEFSATEAVQVFHSTALLGNSYRRIKTSATWSAWTVIITALNVPNPFTPGMVQSFATVTVPSGWLLCDGASVSRTVYAGLFAAIGTAYGAGDGSLTFTLPDFRGQFLRGFDAGRGVDSGRVFGSSQDDEIKSHSHKTNFNNQNGVDPDGFGQGARNVGTVNGYATTAVGGTETRPKNVTVQYCIKT